MILAPESIAGFASLLADRSRAAICVALLDGRAWTASELARHAGIARSTVSDHLDQLVCAGVLAEVRQGRHRYLRLASSEMAQFIEGIATLAGQSAPPTSLRAVRVAQDLASARTCYDHLAGALGVRLFDAMMAAELLCDDGGLTVTDAGRAWFEGLGGPQALHRTPRPLVRACLDWTERRTHLGGALGAVLCEQLAARGWVVPRPGSRAVRVSREGERALADLLGLTAASDAGLSLRSA